MKDPSTTGTNRNVPKKPALLMLTLASCKMLGSTARRQARLSADDEQLKEGLIDDLKELLG